MELSIELPRPNSRCKHHSLIQNQLALQSSDALTVSQDICNKYMPWTLADSNSFTSVIIAIHIAALRLATKALKIRLSLLDSHPFLSYHLSKQDSIYGIQGLDSMRFMHPIGYDVAMLMLDTER